MKINYYGIEQYNLDNRFNEKKWTKGKDIRINKRISKPFKFRIKFKTILWVIFWISLIVVCQSVDKRSLNTVSQPVEASITKVSQEKLQNPVEIVKVDKPLTIQEQILNKFGKDGEKALKISYCESRHNPQTHNYNPKTHDDSYGLFQINLWGNNKLKRPSVEVLTTVEGNINYAYDLYTWDKQKGHNGFTDWVNCSKVNGIK